MPFLILEDRVAFVIPLSTGFYSEKILERCGEFRQLIVSTDATIDDSLVDLDFFDKDVVF